LLFGAHKSAKVAANLARLEIFFRPFVSLPFDDVAAASAARVRAELESAGTPVGPNDLLIASIALAHNLVVVTHNTGELGRIRGLRVEDWVA
jgi:tRNA(fMet)-specific endonuclease VapC